MPKGIKFFGEGLPYQKTSDCKGKLIVVEGTDGVGRSTQIELLAQWLKVRGFGVITTGWTRSKLMSNAIEYAKSGNMLDRETFSLLYATDLADRLENEILPALKSGFLVLADRYVYTAWARDSLRDPSMTWIKNLYGFAPIPDLVCYLRIDVDNLIPRVIEAGGMEYWEAGMDLHLADDIYNSFKKYQKRLIDSYDQMAEDFGFEVLDARRTVVQIQNDLRNRIEKVVGGGSNNNILPFNPGGSDSELVSSRVSRHSLEKESVPKYDLSCKPRFISRPGPSAVALKNVVEPQDELPANPGKNERALPFSSLWSPNFHIPEDPPSKD